jgi:hypothetical protein
MKDRIEDPDFSQTLRSPRLKTAPDKDLSEVVTLSKKQHCVKKTVAPNKHQEKRNYPREHAKDH